MRLRTSSVIKTTPLVNIDIFEVVFSKNWGLGPFRKPISKSGIKMQNFYSLVNFDDVTSSHHTSQHQLDFGPAIRPLHPSREC